MSQTIYVTRIILRPLSALFGSQFMLPMETSVTFIGACTNEIILRNTLENTEETIKKGEIQRNWQHRIHKTNKNTAQYVLDTTMHKQTPIT
jgi:hypothetical protein